MKKFNLLALCAGLCLSCTPLVAMESFSPQPKAHSKTIQGLLPKETYKARAAQYLYDVFFGESLDKPLEIATAKWDKFNRLLQSDTDLQETAPSLRKYLSRIISRIQQSKDNYYKTQLQGYVRERKTRALEALANFASLCVPIETCRLMQTAVIRSMYQELSCDPRDFDPITRIPSFFTRMVTQNLECGLLVWRFKDQLESVQTFEMLQEKIDRLHLIESIEFAQAILDLIDPLDAVD